MKTKEKLHEMYNATSTDDGFGDLETYTNWLEKQLISRIEEIDKLKKANEAQQTESNCNIQHVSGSGCDHNFKEIFCESVFECEKCGKLNFVPAD